MTRRPSLTDLAARGQAASSEPEEPFCLECFARESSGAPRIVKLTPIVAGFRCPRCQRATLQLECGAREVLP